ncbi:unnamed protein product [Discula destructiva]
MLLSSMLVGATALALVTAATTSSTGSSVTESRIATSTSSAAAQTHTISVGASGFVFEPVQVNASVGDTILWRFYPTGHSVVRSEFKQSCIPYEDTGANKVGFYSGFVDVQTTSDNGPTFQVRVNDTEPIFFYCAAPTSCTGHQMIGVINPNATFTYDIQLAYAQNATFQMKPGDPFPSESAETGSATSTPTASSSPSPSSSSNSSSHLGAGAIAGIAIGGAAVLILAVALIYMCGRRGGMTRAFHHGPVMQEARYANGPIGPGPKSPGQETFTTAYSAAPSSDPYVHLHMQQAGHYGGPGAHPLMPGGYPPPSSGSPPPLSEYSQSLYNVHGQHTGGPLMGSPPMSGLDGPNANGFFVTPQVPLHQQRQQPSMERAVELPTSLNPGNSPLPGYSKEQKTYSWVQEGEGTYRPSKP